MTKLEMQQRNLVAALQYGLITWFEYFKAWADLHKNVDLDDL